MSAIRWMQCKISKLDHVDRSYLTSTLQTIQNLAIRTSLIIRKITPQPSQNEWERIVKLVNQRIQSMPHASIETILSHSSQFEDDSLRYVWRHNPVRLAVHSFLMSAQNFIGEKIYEPTEILLIQLREQTLIRNASFRSYDNACDDTTATPASSDNVIHL